MTCGRPELATDIDNPPERTWVMEGLMALSTGGIDSVKIERISKRLGVSKAPFYWRFKDRAALLEAMIDHWKIVFTFDLINIAAESADPRERLESLMRLVLDEESDGIRVSAVEGAVRAWAAQDARIGAIVAEVDAQRVQYIVGELRLLGANGETAANLAKAIYLALIGLYSARRYTPALADDCAFAAMVHVVLGSINWLNIDSKPRTRPVPG